MAAPTAEQAPAKELLIPDRHGIGVLILNTQGQLLTVTEREDKPPKKKAGQLSIVLETAKEHETSQSTLLGALTEVFDDTTIQRHEHELSLALHTDDVVYIGPNKNVLASIAIVMYSGDPGELHVRDVSGKETENYQWLPIDVFLNETNVRPMARDVVTAAVHQGYMRKAYQQPERTSLFPPFFSLERFYAQRELSQDKKVPN